MTDYVFIIISYMYLCHIYFQVIIVFFFGILVVKILFICLFVYLVKCIFYCFLQVSSINNARGPKGKQW